MDQTPPLRLRALPIYFKNTPRTPPGAALVPYMQTLTVLVLSTALLFWPTRTWTHRLIDVNAALVCLTLNYMQQPLLALGLAVTYTLCTCIPGSWSSLNLPEFSEFKRNLEILQPEEDDEPAADCMVCYDNEHPLAKLPCDHKCCTACLDLLAAGYQTTCPACRRPLFSASDELIYALNRGLVSTMAANIVLLFFVSVQDIRDKDYMGLAVRMGSVGVLAPFLWFYGNLMWRHGDDWWRQIFTAAKMTSWDFKVAGCSTAAWIFASSSILWTTRGRFS